MKISELFEAKIDNINGWGNIPDSQNIDYFGLRVLVTPRMFMLLTPSYGAQDKSEIDITNHLKAGGSVASPWFELKIPEGWDDGDYSATARIWKHEGRHRMKAIWTTEGGDTEVETHLFFSGLRARHIKPEWIEQLQKGVITQERHLVPGPWFKLI